MGGKGRKRREKNYVAAHGGTSRLPPPPNPSSINALPSKLRKIMSFTSSINKGLGTESDNTQRKRKRDDVDDNKRHSEAQSKSKGSIIKGERDKRLAMPQVADESKQSGSGDANEEKKKKKKKRKKKQVNDLRFEAEMEKLGVVSKRRQRKKEYLKAKKKKHKKGSSDHQLDLPKRDEIKFGEVVQAPPKLAVIPKAFRQPMNASKERLRLQAIEAYRNRKGWTNRPGIQLAANEFAIHVQHFRYDIQGLLLLLCWSPFVLPQSPSHPPRDVYRACTSDPCCHAAGIWTRYHLSSSALFIQQPSPKKNQCILLTEWMPTRPNT